MMLLCENVIFMWTALKAGNHINALGVLSLRKTEKEKERDNVDDNSQLLSTSIPQSTQLIRLLLRQGEALPLRRLGPVVPPPGGLQLPFHPLQLPLQPLNLPLLLHPVPLQLVHLLLHLLALLLAHGCERPLGVLWHLEEPEDGGVIAHGVYLSVSSAWEYEKVREELTFGFPDDAGAGDWCGAEGWARLLDGCLCARHLGRRS